MKRWVYAAPLFTTITVPWIARIECLVLITITLAIGMGILLSYRPLTDPFVAISDLFTADKRELELERGFTCYDTNQPDDYWCIEYTANQPYSSIYIQVDSRTRKAVDLSFQKNPMRLGDLILLWGQPQTLQLYCRLVVVVWSIQGFQVVSIVSQSHPLNYFAPIAFVTFMSRGLPDWEFEILNEVHSGYCR